jgi:peptide methionine sulfoxide reductase msrA/msrB
MLRWIDVLKFASVGNPAPEKRIERSDAEWRANLTAEQYRVTRQHGTERPFSSEMCELFERGKYACICCGTLLFDSGEKFNSGTGWPSFTQPIRENAIAYHKDGAHGMERVEVLCNTCDAHLGHVFPDGPAPSKLRYCINALALQKVDSTEQKATFGGGCFWCTEAIFQNLKGVIKVESGFSGGDVTNPTYREVCDGKTGHAEVIEVTYDATQITFEDILSVHVGTHNPTTLNKQGGDTGTQYRSIIFYRNDEEKAIATKVLAEVSEAYGNPAVTELAPFQVFFTAEEGHQNYYSRNQGKPYCDAVIEPKLAKFRGTFAHLLG